MGKLPELVPVTELRTEAAEVLERLRASDEPVIITQRGRAAAVMLSVASYEQSESERELLHALARGEKEIAAGAGHDLEDVLADADEIIGSS